MSFTKADLIEALKTNGWQAQEFVEGGKYTLYRHSDRDARVLVARRGSHMLEEGDADADEGRVEITDLKQVHVKGGKPIESPIAKAEEKLEKRGSSNANVKDGAKKRGIAVDEAELRKKYKHVIPGTIRKETSGKWAGKYTVEIETLGIDMLPDGNKRRVATSDLFQVKHTEEVYDQIRNLRRRERYATVKVGRASTRKAAAAK